ncbi:hypothetical protein GGH96_006318, partial [Coemansia sp. RSA 1972]
SRMRRQSAHRPATRTSEVCWTPTMPMRRGTRTPSRWSAARCRHRRTAHTSRG